MCKCCEVVVINTSEITVLTDGRRVRLWDVTVVNLLFVQDGATLRHRCHPTRRQNAKTEDEDGSSQPHVGYLDYCLPFNYNNRLI